MGYRSTELVRGLESRDRSSGYWLVLMVLSTYAKDRDGLCWPSLEKIAKGSKLSVKMTRRHIQQLKRDGLITVLSNPHGGRPGATPTYKLNFVDREVVHTTPLEGPNTGATSVPCESFAISKTSPTDGRLIRNESSLNQIVPKAQDWKTKPTEEWNNSDYVASGNALGIRLKGLSFEEFKSKVLGLYSNPVLQHSPNAR